MGRRSPAVTHRRRGAARARSGRVVCRVRRGQVSPDLPITDEALGLAIAVFNRWFSALKIQEKARIALIRSSALASTP